MVGTGAYACATWQPEHRPSSHVAEGWLLCWSEREADLAPSGVVGGTIATGYSVAYACWLQRSSAPRLETCCEPLHGWGRALACGESLPDALEHACPLGLTRGCVS